MSADLRAAVERGVDPDKSLVAKKRKEMKPIDPAPEKKFKYFNPLTGHAFEGTVAEREAHMREWMGAYQGGTPVTPVTPMGNSTDLSGAPASFMAPPGGYGTPLPAGFPPPAGTFPPPGFGYGQGQA